MKIEEPPRFSHNPNTSSKEFENDCASMSVENPKPIVYRRNKTRNLFSELMNLLILILCLLA
jgi:hypothetical protein